MGKILSTNLLTYNGYSSSELFNRILSVPEKIDYKIVQIASDSERPGTITTRGTRIYENNMTWDNYIPNLPSSYGNNWILAGTVPITDAPTGGIEVECWYEHQSGPTEFEMVTLDSTQKTSVLNVYTNSIVPAMNNLGYNQWAYKPDTYYGLNALLQGDNGKWYGMAAATPDWSAWYYVPFELESDFSFIKIGTPGIAPTGDSPNYYNIIYVFGDSGPQDWAISQLVSGVTTVNELGGYIAGLLGY